MWLVMLMTTKFNDKIMGDGQQTSKENNTMTNFKFVTKSAFSIFEPLETERLLIDSKRYRTLTDSLQELLKMSPISKVEEIFIYNLEKEIHNLESTIENALDNRHYKVHHDFLISYNKLIQIKKETCRLIPIKQGTFTRKGLIFDEANNGFLNFKQNMIRLLDKKSFGLDDSEVRVLVFGKTIISAYDQVKNIFGLDEKYKYNNFFEINGITLVINGSDKVSPVSSGYDWVVLDKEIDFKSFNKNLLNSIELHKNIVVF